MNITKKELKKKLNEEPTTAINKWKWNKDIVKKLLVEIIKLESRIKILENMHTRF